MASLREQYLQQVLAEPKKPKFQTEQIGIGDTLGGIGKAVGNIKVDDKQGLFENIANIGKGIAEPLTALAQQKAEYEQGPEAIQKKIQETNDPRLQMELLKDLETAKGGRASQMQAYQQALEKRTGKMGEIARQEELDSLERDKLANALGIETAKLGTQQNIENQKAIDDTVKFLVEKKGMSPEEALLVARQKTEKGIISPTTRKGIPFINRRTAIDPKSQAYQQYLASINK